MEFVGWCSPADSKREAAFVIRRKARARDRPFVSVAKRTKFRPRRQSKAAVNVRDRLVWQRKPSSTPTRIGRQRQAANVKRNSHGRSTFEHDPSNRDRYRPIEKSALLRTRM